MDHRNVHDLILSFFITQVSCRYPQRPFELVIFFLPCFCSTHWSPLKSACCSHTNLLHHRTSRRMPIHTTQPFFSLWDPITLPKLYRRIRAQTPSDFLAHKPILGQPSPHTPAHQRSEFRTSESWFQGPSIPWEWEEMFLPAGDPSLSRGTNQVKGWLDFNH